MFTPAGQPDIVRSAQKDELYLQIVTDGITDAACGLLGPRRALLTSREISLVSSLLYHALTTGAGSQTLGEEYCDLLQVTGGIPLEAGVSRRMLLVLLQSVVPYWLQRWSPDPGAELAGSASPPDALVGTSRPDSSGNEQLPLLPHQRLWQQVQPAFQRGLGLLKQHSGLLMRLHLALFYIHGVYYQWPKRLAGIRYAFIGRTFEQRASYRVLGTLLFMQLALTTSLGAIDSLAKSAANGQQVGNAADGQNTKAGHAVVMQQEASGGSRQGPSHGAAAASATVQPDGEVRSHQRCPLCLSARRHPTSTPCGHLFCWTCIAEWCNQKPECPLCRSTFTASELVCAHGTDL